MAEDNKEKWISYVALTTVVLAVCATLSTFKGGQYSTRSVMSQSQASNQWAFYQSKSIKAYIHEAQKEALEAELKRLDSGPAAEPRQELTERLRALEERLKRYEQEKADISAQAKHLEGQRDQAQQHSQVFGLAVIFLQIAILLSSISALLKKKPVWFLGLGLGLCGLVYFLDGYFLWF